MQAPAHPWRVTCLIGWALLWGLGGPGAARAETPGELAALKAGGIAIHDLAVPDGGGVSATFFVAATLAVARAVMWDTPRFPEFIPGSHEVVMREQGPTRQVTAMSGGEGPVTVRFVTERRLEPKRIVWRLLSGDLKHNDGFWAFVPTAGGTLVTYQVHITPNAPVPGGVVTFLQKQALPRMIRAVRRRIESRAASKTR